MVIKVNFDKIKIIKTLGQGVFGVGKLVSYNNKNYVLKTQKLPAAHRIKNIKYPIWRELDFYKYIEKLPKNHQNFFMKLIDYRIYKTCDHKIKKQKFINPKIVKEYNDSPWCVDFLVEYKGESFSKFLIKNKLSKEQVISFILQISIIHSILKKGKYFHTDFFIQNITISKTKQKNINLILHNKKLSIPTYGYVLSVIDYGSILHNKYRHQKRIYYQYPELKRVEALNTVCFNIISQYESNNHKCKRFVGDENYRITISQILKIKKNYPVKWEKYKYFLTKYFPLTKNYFNKLEKNKLNSTDRFFISFIKWRIHDMFQLENPKIHANFFGWKHWKKSLLDKNTSFKLFFLKRVEHFITYSLSLLNNY